MAEQTAVQKTAKADEIQGTTILTTEEPEIKAPEKTLFKAAPTVEEAKAAAIQELADKTASDAAKKAETTATTVTDAKVPTVDATKTPDKATTTTQTDYTLNLPENSALTKEELDATLKDAKASGLTEDKAKEMLQSKDQLAKASQTRLLQKQEQDLKTMVTGWKETVNKDPELGGERLAETAIKSSRAAKAIFDNETLKFLNDTGYGNHPGLVRAMLKVHDLIGEDKFIRGSTGVGNPTPTTIEEKAKKLFGNPIKETV